MYKSNEGLAATLSNRQIMPSESTFLLSISTFLLFISTFFKCLSLVVFPRFYLILWFHRTYKIKLKRISCFPLAFHVWLMLLDFHWSSFYSFIGHIISFILLLLYLFVRSYDCCLYISSCSSLEQSTLVFSCMVSYVSISFLMSRLAIEQQSSETIGKRGIYLSSIDSRSIINGIPSLALHERSLVLNHYNHPSTLRSNH